MRHPTIWDASWNFFPSIYFISILILEYFYLCPFLGQFAYVNVWSYTLSDSEIKGVYGECTTKVPPGDIVSMTNPLVPNWKISNVRMELVPTTTRCQPKTDNYIAIVPTIMAFKDAFHLCTLMGGQLPTFQNFETYPIKYNVLQDRIRDLDPNHNCKAQDTSRVKFWGGYTRKLDRFYNSYTKVQAHESLHDNINWGRKGDCFLVFGPELKTYMCHQPYGCVACHVPHVTRFTLKGLCNEATA
jgi:hypothetical protein